MSVSPGMGHDLFGIPVVESRYLREDTAILVNTFGRTYVLRGIRPLTEVERAGVEAKYIVRDALADVLAWLGERP